MAHSDQTNKITNSAANVTDFMWPHNNMTFETYSNILLLLVTLLLLSTAVVLYQNITIWGLCPQLWTLGTLPPTFANTIWMSNQSSKFFERGLPQSRTTPDSSHFTLLVMETEDVKVMWMVNEEISVCDDKQFSSDTKLAVWLSGNALLLINTAALMKICVWW